MVPSKGVCCTAENNPSRKGRQAGECGAVLPEQEAAVNGISGLWGCTYLE